MFLEPKILMDELTAHNIIVIGICSFAKSVRSRDALVLFILLVGEESAK